MAAVQSGLFAENLILARTWSHLTYGRAVLTIWMWWSSRTLTMIILAGLHGSSRTFIPGSCGWESIQRRRRWTGSIALRPPIAFRFAVTLPEKPSIGQGR